MVEPEEFVFPEDGRFPNSILPTLVYRGVGFFQGNAMADWFRKNGWPADWRTSLGFYTFPHYHSNSHEAIGVARGSVSGHIGGTHGLDMTLNEGDVIVLPAGTGHIHISASCDLVMFGTYPEGSEDWNLHRAVPTEKAWAKMNISRVPLPSSDPVYGVDGPLTRLWGAKIKLALATASDDVSGERINSKL